jgi:predicted RNase H-related nuclease YkuK (DUF458 family)
MFANILLLVQTQIRWNTHQKHSYLRDTTNNIVVTTIAVRTRTGGMFYSVYAAQKDHDRSARFKPENNP